jgi:uncharacterized protein YndB with AHSA1/START domain
MTSETDSSEDGEVVVECGLDASPEKIWRALTVPELAADWLGAEHEPASRADAAATFQIIDLVPFTRLVYRWTDRSEKSPTESTVTVEIKSHGTGASWFRLTHRPPASLAAANGNARMALAA